MKTKVRILSYVLVFTTVFTIDACNNTAKGTAVNVENLDSDRAVTEGVVSDSSAQPMEGAMETAEVKEETSGSPFDSVEMWEITFTGVTTIYKPISAKEAKRIEASGDDNYWVSYDERERQWYLHGLDDVETGSVTVTDPKWVKQLNLLMQNPKYDLYREDVSIRGKIAYAKWYEGNRGGGIAEDFPRDVIEYLEYLRSR